MVLDPFHRLTVWNIDERQPNIQQARRCRCLQYKHKGPSTNVKQPFKHLQILIHESTWKQQQQIRQKYLMVAWFPLLTMITMVHVIMLDLLLSVTAIRRIKYGDDSVTISYISD
jgi:hypothetical protein